MLARKSVTHMKTWAGRSVGRSLPWHGRGRGFKSRPVQDFLRAPCCCRNQGLSGSRFPCMGHLLLGCNHRACCSYIPHSLLLYCYLASSSTHIFYYIITFFSPIYGDSMLFQCSYETLYVRHQFHIKIVKCLISLRDIHPKFFRIGK